MRCVKAQTTIMLIGIMAIMGIMMAVPEPVFAGSDDGGILQKFLNIGTDEEVSEYSPARPLAFEEDRPEVTPSRCFSTPEGILLRWKEVAGATGYEVYRAKSAKGEYTKFAVTDELRLKAETDGEYYYKVRAIKNTGREKAADKAKSGEVLKSKWSLTVRLFSMSGYVTKMYSDDKDYTHFKIKLRNRTDRQVLLKGNGLTNVKQQANYFVHRYNLETGEETSYSFPAALIMNLPVYQSVVIPARGEDTIDLFIPRKLETLGKTGMREKFAADPAGETAGTRGRKTAGKDASGSNAIIAKQPAKYGYQISLILYPDMAAPSYEMTLTEVEEESAVFARPGSK